MHHRKLMNKDWKHVEEIFQKKLNFSRSKMLSVGGRLVLINSVLSSLPMFMLFFFFKYLEGFCGRWITLGHGFFDRVMITRKSIG